MQRPNRIQLSADAFSCFIDLPIEIKQSRLNGSLVILTDTASWTFDQQRIAVNSIDCNPPVVRGGRS